MARMHAATWNDKTLLEHDYLVNAEWMKNKNKDYYEETLNGLNSTYYETFKEKEETDLYEANLFVISLLDAQVERTNFDDTVQELQNQNFALCHGDPHLSNFLWNKEKQQSMLIDFEFISIANPMTDLAYFMSAKGDYSLYYEDSVNAAFRKRYEDKVLEVYYQELTQAKAKIKDTYSFE